jgi:hypothetical protein
VGGLSGQLALRAADGATVTLERFPIIVGRITPEQGVPDVDVTDLDPQGGVDGRHCELFPDPDGIEVHDLGAVHGTWVDGRRLAPGGRALLPVGGRLRIAGVELTLIPAPPRRPVANSGPPPALSDWREPSPISGVPLPPSASRSEVPVIPQPRRGVDLDLSQAPLPVRTYLEEGAQSVRMVEGLPLQVRPATATVSRGQPISAAMLEEALAGARASLRLPGDAQFGWGYAGDLEIDFVAGSLATRASLGVTVCPPLTVDAGTMAAAASWVAEGGALLLAGRRPERILQQLEPALLGAGPRPWALCAGDASWLSSGWAVLPAGAPESIRAALEGDPLIVHSGGDGELAAVLTALPRTAGGTVVVLESASAEAALEHCFRLLAARLAPSGSELKTTREEVAQRLPRLLTWRPGAQLEWCTVEMRPEETAWTLAPVAER